LFRANHRKRAQKKYVRLYIYYESRWQCVDRAKVASSPAFIYPIHLSVSSHHPGNIEAMTVGDTREASFKTKTEHEHRVPTEKRRSAQIISLFAGE
jgi:hypothetical protein